MPTLVVFIVGFFVLTIFAVNYCKHYQPNPFPRNDRPPVIVEVVTVDCGKHLGAIKATAAEYSSRNRQTRFLVLPLTRAQIQTYTSYDLLISLENEQLYAFVITQNEQKKDAVRALLELLHSKHELNLVV